MNEVYLTIILAGLGGGATITQPMEGPKACVSVAHAMQEASSRKNNEYLCISKNGDFVWSSKLGHLIDKVIESKKNS